MQELRETKTKKGEEKLTGFSETLGSILVNFLGNINSCVTYRLSPVERVHNSGKVSILIIYKVKHHHMKCLMETLQTLTFVVRLDSPRNIIILWSRTWDIYRVSSGHQRREKWKWDSLKLVTFDLSVLSFFKTVDNVKSDYKICTLGGYYLNNQVFFSASKSSF